MLIIPVIDIKDGKCVRVVEGLADKTLYYSESPISMARLFRKENAKIIHITDLDGAYTGNMNNFKIIKDIVDSVGVPVQIGGGIRTYETVKKLIDEVGVYRVVIGTSAIDDIEMVQKLLEDFSPRKIVIGVDVRNGFLVRDGWVNQTNIKGVDFALGMKAVGIERVIYQDITRVGTFLGPNFEGLAELAEMTKMKITAAGGIGGYLDLRRIQELESIGVDSVMMSRPLYENKFPCMALWREQEKIDTSLELPKVK
jgi:phosphoribosylformimino-5-aminoimidazole carboxamide ribotide isomerase